MSSILIVDDEAGVRASLGAVLRDEGYDVDVAESGEACLEAVTRRVPGRDPAGHLAARHGRHSRRSSGCASGAWTRRSS